MLTICLLQPKICCLLLYGSTFRSGASRRWKLFVAVCSPFVPTVEFEGYVPPFCNGHVHMNQQSSGASCLDGVSILR
jgi:hypothetical protein